MKKIAPEMKTYNIQNVEDLEQISDLIHSKKIRSKQLIKIIQVLSEAADTEKFRSG